MKSSTGSGQLRGKAYAISCYILNLGSKLITMHDSYGFKSSENYGFINNPKYLMTELENLRNLNRRLCHNTYILKKHLVAISNHRTNQ